MSPDTIGDLFLFGVVSVWVVVRNEGVSLCPTRYGPTTDCLRPPMFSRTGRIGPHTSLFVSGFSESRGGSIWTNRVDAGLLDRPSWRYGLGFGPEYTSEDFIEVRVSSSPCSVPLSPPLHSRSPLRGPDGSVTRRVGDPSPGDGGPSRSTWFGPWCSVAGLVSGQRCRTCIFTSSSH